MGLKNTLAASAICIFGFTTSASAENVDFGRFLASASGASGIAAAVASLGKCASPIWWGYAWDDALGDENKDHLFVACQYHDEQNNQLSDKSVVARFSFWNEVGVLESLVYHP